MLKNTLIFPSLIFLLSVRMVPKWKAKFLHIFLQLNASSVPFPFGLFGHANTSRTTNEVPSHRIFFIVTNWTSSVCKSTNSQRGKKANFFPTFFVENTQQNTMNNWWIWFDGGAQFLFTQFTRISLEIMLKNYNFSEMI